MAVQDEEEISTEITTDDNTEEATAQSSSFGKEEYTYEEVLALEERVKKAEALIVEKKKAEKAQKQKGEDSPQPTEGYITRKELELERFIDKNPELAEYQREIQDFTKDGRLSLEQARVLVLNSDVTISNRAKISRMNLTSTEGGTRSTTFSRDDLGKMKQNEYNKAMEAIKSGKARLV